MEVYGCMTKIFKDIQMDVWIYKLLHVQLTYRHMTVLTDVKTDGK